jgi:hypothetical protein
MLSFTRSGYLLALLLTAFPIMAQEPPAKLPTAPVAKKAAPAKTAPAEYKPVVPSSKARRGGSVVAAALRGDNKLESAEDQQAFDAYVMKWEVAQLVDPKYYDPENKNPKTRGAYTSVRAGIKRKLQAGRQGPAHDRFNQRAIDTIKLIINPRSAYRPVVKFNAVLLLSDLDAVEPQMRGGAVITPGVPMPEAVPLLRVIATAKAFPDLLKVGALQGLKRHMAAGIRDGAEAARVHAAMTTIVLGALPEGRSEDVHDWIQSRAAEVLIVSSMKDVEMKGVKMLVTAMRDAQLPLATRVTVATTLLTADLTKIPRIKPATVKALRGEIQKVLQLARAKVEPAPGTKKPDDEGESQFE